MRRQKATSTPTAETALATALARYKSATGPADIAITADQFAILDTTNPTSFLSQFLANIAGLETADAVQGNGTVTLNGSFSSLQMLVSHFSQTLDLGIARGYFAPAARAYYGRDITNAVLPPLVSMADAAESAKQIIDGEVRRQNIEGAAFKPMAMPAASEVAAALTQFNTDQLASQLAQRATNTAQENVSTMTPAAIENANDIGDTVEFFYRHDPDPSSFRSKCAQWGNVYVDDSTPPAPTPPPTPATEPTAPPAA